MNNRRRLIIIVSVIALVAIIIISIAIKATTPKDDPKQAYLKSAIVTTTDQDTGEQITIDPNLSAQTDEERTVTVLGMEAMVNIDTLTPQINFIKDAVNTFSSTRLKNKYTTITLRPEGLTTTDGVTTTTIRLGQTDEILPIIITAKNTGETEVVIQDPSNKYGGQFDTGLTVYSGD